MKRNLFYLLMGGILISSCSSEENISEQSNLRRIEASICNFQMEDSDGATRTSYTLGDEGYEAVWATGDVLGIYPLGGDQVAFPISDGIGTSTAVFDGGAWALRGTYKYAAYYPFSKENYTISETEIPVTYIGQKQSGNNSTTHLAPYDYMAAAATQPSSDGSVILPFKHLGAYLTLPLTLPKAGTYTNLTLTSNNGRFITQGIVDLSAVNPAITSTKTSSSISLDLNNVVLADDNLVLTLNMLIAPADLTGSTIEIAVKDNQGNIYKNTTDWTRTKAFAANTTTIVPRTLATEGSGGNNGGDDGSDTTPYLTFNADATQSFQMSEAVSTLEYSVNYGPWSTLGETRVDFGGSNGNLRLRGKSANGTVGSQISFGNDAKVSCHGDIRTLVDYENYELADCSSAKFSNLFYGCTSLTTAPELPTTALASSCYSGMFRSCSSLTTAPELPATSLASNCYSKMFYGCSSLTTAPELPATSLADNCYNSMFYRCSRLTTTPELPATTLASGCYQMMFENCTSLTTAPELPATSLAQDCYDQMFYGCFALTSAPELPATTLASGCYSDMFYNCTSLTIAPELPATSLALGCYQRMFENCTSLTTAPELPATSLALGCYSFMFRSCTSLTTAPELPATSLANNCYKGMFYGCTSLTTAPELSATSLDDYCYCSMFEGCSSLTTAPDLPATTLANNCYEGMFLGCSKLSYVKMDALSIPTDATQNWLYGVASYGTFVKNKNATWNITGSNGIPQGWTVASDNNGHEQVDLGLPSGTLWATCNVGASFPEEYGDYFAWGEVVPYYEAGHSLDSPCQFWKTGKTAGYNWSSNKWTHDGASFTKYTIDGLKILEAEDDAATANWGSTWHMPTKTELQELLNESNCTWTWITLNGVHGYKVTSKTNGNSIFLPVAGYRSETRLYKVGVESTYWSSSLSPNESKLACFLEFGEGFYGYDWSAGDRYFGHPVRAVCK